MKEVVRAMSVNGRYYVSSACAGTNISFICQAVLVYIITDGECYAVDAFNCEFDKGKQDFLVNNMDAHPFNNRCEPSPCVHPDLLDLDKSSAVCLAHHGDSKNTHCKIWFSSQNSTGFSCKDLSLMNNNRGKFKSVVKNKGKSKSQSPTSGGSTGKTADGLVRHLGCHQVPCGLAENVPQLLSKASDNWRNFKDALLDVGFCCEAALCHADQQGASVERHRTWIAEICCRQWMMTQRDAESRLQSWKETFDRLKIPPIRRCRSYLRKPGDK
jgi:hypothetical protein